MSKEACVKQFEEDRKEAVRIAARLLLASATTTPRVGGVGECTIDLCQAIERMSGENERWDFFNRDAAMLRDADAVLLVTSLRCAGDPGDFNCNLCGKLTCEYLRQEEKLPDEPGIVSRRRSDENENCPQEYRFRPGGGNFRNREEPLQGYPQEICRDE
jgi:hypothetical protein